MRALLIALLFMIAGCATVNTSRPMGAVQDGEQVLSDRESVLFERSHFSLQGRIAVSNGKDGGSGRFYWEQRGAAFTLRFLAPVGAQNWRLESQPGQALLIESNGAVRVATSADELLRRELGWHLPSRALRFWILGMRAPESVAEAIVRDGQLGQLRQDGWTIDYLRFDQNAPALPTKLFASNGKHEVRLSVREWDFEPKRASGL